MHLRMKHQFYDPAHVHTHGRCSTFDIRHSIFDSLSFDFRCSVLESRCLRILFFRIWSMFHSRSPVFNVLRRMCGACCSICDFLWCMFDVRFSVLGACFMIDSSKLGLFMLYSGLPMLDFDLVFRWLRLDF